MPTAVYRPELHPHVRTDATGHFTFKSVVPGTYRIYAWERLDLIPDPTPGSTLTSELIVFPDLAFPRLFDNLGAVVMVGENESKQVSLTLISAAKMARESRGLH